MVWECVRLPRWPSCTETAGSALPRKRFTSSTARVYGDGVRLPVATSSTGTSTTSPLNNIFKDRMGVATSSLHILEDMSSEL